MASFNDCLTTAGQRIFALMAKGSKVTFTRVVLGDGIKQDGVSESQMTDLINPVVTLNIDSVTKSADNKVTIRSVFSNTQTVDPFYLREKGVYATTDGTDECLVFYANNGVLAEYIDVAKTQLIEKIIRTVIMFSESDNINITMSSSGYSPPTIMTDSTLEDFIEKGESVEEGSEIIVTNGDGEKEIYVYTGGDPFDMNNYLQVYGTRALVVMHEYIPIEERIKGSMYLLLGKTRRLMVKVFKKFFGKTKNLLEITATSQTVNGVTFTVNEDGSVIVNGTATADTELYVRGTLNISGNYILSGCPSGGSSTTYHLFVKTDGTTYYDDVGNGINFAPNSYIDYIKIRIESGVTVSNLTFYPMIRPASITDDTYEPYQEVEADVNTLLFQKTTEKTTNVADGNNYRILCKNFSILQPGEDPERLEGKFYLKADSE